MSEKHISEIKVGDVINMQGIWCKVLSIEPEVTAWGQRSLKMSTQTVVDGAPLLCWYYGNMFVEVREVPNE